MSNRPAVHRTIVVVDVAGFGHHGRTNGDQLAVREELYDILHKVFADVGIPWDECDHEDRGDGVLVLIPPEIPKSYVVDVLPEKVAAALNAHNGAMHVVAAPTSGRRSRDERE